MPVLLRIVAGPGGGEVWLAQRFGTDAATALFPPHLEGLEVRDPAVAPREGPPVAAPLEPLTPREREVLELVVDGLANAAIAERLGVSGSTVKFHLASLFAKFGVAGRTELAVAAVRAGVAFL